MAAAARCAQFHPSRDTGAYDQLPENERANCAPAVAHHGIIGSGAWSRQVMVARLARVHGWHASPHERSGTLRTVSC